MEVIKQMEIRKQNLIEFEQIKKSLGLEVTINDVHRT